MYSLCELSPLNLIPRNHCFIVLSKNYFDGGNQASGLDAQGFPYRVITLAALSGLKCHWDRFEREWKKVLRKYRVGHLHTTDAVALSSPYSKKQGW